MKTPADQRLEVLTLKGHISFESQKLVLQRREPQLPTKDEEPAEDPDKPRDPFEVKVDKIEPSTVGSSNETIGTALSDAYGIEPFRRTVSKSRSMDHAHTDT